MIGSAKPTTPEADSFKTMGFASLYPSYKLTSRSRLQLDQHCTERYGAAGFISSEIEFNRWAGPMHTLPVDRALSIYGALADRSESKGVRERLSRHLMKLYIDGEKNEHRLTVHGLSYLRELDREIDSRN